MTKTRIATFVGGRLLGYFSWATSVGLVVLVLMPAVGREAFAQKTRPMDFHQATGEQARVKFVRGIPSVVQDLVMGPEATLLWKRLQQLINDPQLEDLSRVLDTLDLRVTLPMNEVDKGKPGSQVRNDLTDVNGLVKSARYGIAVDYYPFPTGRSFVLALNFNNESICLSKQEIQRVFSTEFEQAGVHASHVMWPDKTGREHGFRIAGGAASFHIAASGCATEVILRKKFEDIRERP